MSAAATPIIAPAAPKNARSKRAAQAREPVAIEKGAKTAIFVRGSQISEKVKVALSELVRQTGIRGAEGRAGGWTRRGQLGEGGDAGGQANWDSTSAV